jgi:uncharacterized iron-regulated protein
MLKPVEPKRAIKPAFWLTLLTIGDLMKPLRPFQNLLFLAGSCVLALSGCMTTRPAMPPSLTVKGVPERFQIGQIVDMNRAEAVRFDDLITALSGCDVIFIGEIHDNPEHHLIEVQILQALADRVGDRLAVGMEFFQRESQEAIDRYLHGSISESGFLEAVDWKESWGFDYFFYRPLMLLSKERGLRVLALNAPNVIVRKVARVGLSGLTAEERDHIAKHIDLGNEAERAYVREAFEGHEHADLKQFERFYEAQSVWEATMAETISHHLASSGGKMVVFSGSGHIVYKFGIPERTLQRIPVTEATVVLHPAGSQEQLDKNLADFVWITDDCSSAPPVLRSMSEANDGTGHKGKSKNSGKIR